MPAPKNPNTAAATAAVLRRGDETAAKRLYERGWYLVAPDRADEVRAIVAGSGSYEEDWEDWAEAEWKP